MLLSLIIPFYKSEKYIVECLDSVVRELTDDLEVILVDDGSPDRSIELIRERYARQIQNKQFIIFQICNSGPGAARNVGVKSARGDYVGFLDSDDVLLSGYFDRIATLLRSYAGDLIQFNCKRYTDTKSLIKEPIIKCHSSAGHLMLNDVRNEIFGIGRWFPPTRIFKRDLLVNCPFAEGVFYEDLQTMPFIFMGNHSITLINDCLYGYRQHEFSITSNHSLAHAEDLLKFFVRISELPETVPLSILKIQVGRALSYFSAELKLPEVPRQYIVNKIRQIDRKLDVKVHLKLPDRLFFSIPELYFWMDKWRLRLV